MNYNGVAHISTFPPTKCGIAYYTFNLKNALAVLNPTNSNLIINVSFQSNVKTLSDNQIYLYGNNIDSYKAVADAINESDIRIVSLQHEFKIFTGSYGDNILYLLENLKKPIVTTAHAILPNLRGYKATVFKQILEMSNHLICFSNKGQEILVDKYSLSKNNCSIIPHGSPSINISRFYKRLNERVSGRIIKMATVCFLRPNRGIEFALYALSKLKKRYENFRYYIIGINHPRVRNAQMYRMWLYELTNKLGIGDQVMFINDYIPMDELIDFISGCDFCLAPYIREEQSSSGTLPLYLSCGKPVISNKFQYAEAFINNKFGWTLPFNNSDIVAEAIFTLINERERRVEMSINAYLLSIQYTWLKTAKEYQKIFSNISSISFYQKMFHRPNNYLAA